MIKKLLAIGSLALLIPSTAIAGELTSGPYLIQSASNSLQRISLKDSKDNTVTKMEKSSNSANQKFYFTKLSDGTYKIATFASVLKRSLTAGDKIYQYGYSGSTNQKWNVTQNNDSSYTISNAGKAITINGKDLILQKIDNNNKLQKFNITSFNNKYTVSFYDGVNTTSIKKESVKKGESATAPETPTREGYTFAGWDKDFSNVTSNLKVTAKWTANATYKVIFTDGQGNNLKTQNISKGGYATAPTNPTRTGYTFAGWDKPFNNITADTTITAKWTAKEVKVVFHKNDGTTENYTESYTYGKTGQTFGMNLTSKTGDFGNWKRTGYKLLGWSLDKNATNKQYNTYSNVVDSWINEKAPTVNVYAIWQKSEEIADIKDGWYTITPTLNSAYAMDVNGAVNTNGANIQLWTKNNSDAQKFFIHKIDSETYNIMTGTLGYQSAIDLDNSKINGNIHQWTYSSGSKNQLWKIVKANNGYVFFNKATGNVLDIEGDDTIKDGKNIWDYQYLNGNDKGQTFTLTPTSKPSSVDGKKKIIFKGTNQTLNIQGGSALDKAKVIAYENGEGNNSKFAFEKQSDGTYHIRALNSDRYLLDENGKIVQSRGSSIAFRWKIVWNGDGTVSFKNLNSGKFLYATSTANSTQLTTTDKNTDVKTHFTLPSTDYTQVIANGTYMIKSGAGMYLTTEYNNWDNGTKIAGATSYTDIKKGMRLFRVTYLGNGNYRFETGSSIYKSSIDMPNNVDSVGIQPQQYRNNNVNAQKFHIIGSGNGDWRISHNARNIQTTTNTDPCTMQETSDNAAQKMTFTKSNGYLIQDTYKYYFREDGTTPKLAIDVSKWQGDINWTTIKNAGRVDFAIIRILDHSSSTTTGVDAYALKNIEACEKLGIPYGIYWYSMATTTSELKSELSRVWSALGSHKPTKGIWFDMEAINVYKTAWGSNWQSNGTGKSKLTEFINYAKSDIKSHGFEPGLYLNKAQITCIDPTSFGIKWWCPRYFTNSSDDTSLLDINSSTYKGAYMWQWADTYTMNGINGSRVDVDCVFYDDSLVWNGSSLVKSDTSASNKKTYTVTFSDGSKVLKCETVIEGSSATAPANPTKTGYTFAGWDKSFNNVTSNITVTAKWTVKKVKVVFKINYASSWSDWTEEYIYGAANQKFGMKLSANLPGQFGNWDREGYKLLGWSHDANATSATYGVYSGVADSWINSNTGTVNLYAVWQNKNGKNGWVDENGWRYYKNGTKVTGWYRFTSADGESTEHYSYFDSNGKLVTGWFMADSGYETLRYADANGWVYGPCGFKTNVATTPNVGVTKYSDGSTGALNGSYYFNDKGELIQVMYNNFTHLNQRSYFATSDINYGNGCGPVSGLMAANMMGKLKNYVGSTYTTSSNRYSASASFRNYMSTWQESTGNTYVGRTGGDNGVWNYQIKNNLLYWHNVDAEYIEDNTMYSSDRLRGILTWGRVAIPFCNVKLSGIYAKHFMLVNGWRLKDGAVQYHVVDPYGETKLDPNCAGQNDGWYSISGMESISYKGSGKTSASDSSRAVRNFTVVGTRMRFGF